MWLDKSIVQFDKPLYTRLTALEVSKNLMYNYHYNVMKKHYNNSTTLMYTGYRYIIIFIIVNIIIINITFFINSFVYYIQTDNFYADLLANLILLNSMDTVNLLQSHPSYIAERKQIHGLFSDKTNYVGVHRVENQILCL